MLMLNNRKFCCPSCGVGHDEAHADWCEYKECPWCSREHLQGQCATDRYKRKSKAATPTEGEAAEEVPTNEVGHSLSPPEYTLAYGRILRGTEGCRRLGTVEVFAPLSGTGTESAGVFASPEQAVEAWLSHMRSKAADVEDITRLGWRGWGLVFRCADARGRIRLFSVMVDEQMSEPDPK